MKRIYNLLFALVVTLTLLSNYSFAQTSFNKIVYLKNPAGILLGVIVYRDTIFSSIKVNSFCAVQKLTQGNLCEELAPTSPFALDPKKALKFVNSNPNISPEAFNQIKASIDDLASKLKALAPVTPDIYQNITDAAIPDYLDGTDLSKTARTYESE